MSPAPSTPGRVARRPSPLARLSALAGLVLAAGGAFAQGAPQVLDRDRVVDLARRQAPDVAVAEAAVGEAQALHVGARMLAPENPAVFLRGGWRIRNPGTDAPDLSVGLSWPVDISGARHQRWGLADQLSQAAEAHVLDMRRIAIGEALDLWVRAVGAAERVQLETARSTLDEQLLAAARVRRQAGTVGDADVALATILRAEGIARLRSAEAERVAATALLVGRLGLPPGGEVVVAGTLDTPEPTSLETLLHGLSRRGDLARGLFAVRAAQVDARLQARLGLPIPRLALLAGRDSDTYLQGGLDVPLPIYQRNQTARAVSEARIPTREAELAGLRARAQAELRAAWSTHQGARAAADALEEALPAMADAELLATRGYELGQTDLSRALVARRETALARAARLEARITRARTRVALDQAAGLLP